MNGISVDHITKTYGDVKALSDISFSVDEGELFGLIGPDGAGKTSLFRILTTLLLPDSGSATVMGCDVVSGYREIRRHVGYMPGRFSLYQDLTVEENLTFFASVFQTTIRENYDLIKDIYIQLLQDQQHLNLTVEDNGSGFDPKDRPAGLGLKNVLSRVEYLEGRLDIQSEPGVGTTITIDFDIT